MNNKLVVYFSASGVTKIVAQTLASALKSNIYEIEPVNPYTDKDLDWRNSKSRSSLEMKDPASRPQIKNKILNFSSYKYIFIGFPIWWYREPSIIDTFLESYDFTNKIIIPFYTSGGSGFGKTKQNISSLAKNALVKEDRRFSISVKESELKNWFDSLLILD